MEGMHRANHEAGVENLKVVITNYSLYAPAESRCVCSRKDERFDENDERDVSRGRIEKLGKSIGQFPDDRLCLRNGRLLAMQADEVPILLLNRFHKRAVCLLPIAFAHAGEIVPRVDILGRHSFEPFLSQHERICHELGERVTARKN